MKKSVCLMAILGALGATSAFAAGTQFSQTINVKFAGEVVNTNCTVSVVNGQNNTVKLANLNLNVANDPNARGDLVPVVFKFEKCAQNDQITSIALVSDVLMGDPTTSDVKNGVLSTDKKNVVVQMYKNNGGVEQGLADISKSALTGGNGYVTVGYAALKRLTEKPAAGKVNAEGMFEVTYN